VFLAGVLFASAAWGQEHPSNPPTNWDISIWAAGATGEENTNSFVEAGIWTAGLSIARAATDEIGGGWRRGRLVYGFSLIPLFLTAKTQRVYGGGFEPVILRFDSSHHAGRVFPYIEVAGGGIFAGKNIPPGNTSSFNFTARAGGGIQVFDSKRQALDLSCRWFHASNANLGVRNPEFNGIQISLGYHWFKSRLL
jgi:hypothetical protein